MSEKNRSEQSEKIDSPENRQAFRVSIFGTATDIESDTGKEKPAIKLAYNLGEKFIDQGFSISTGGYAGIMKAASDGAATKAEVLGINPKERVFAYTMTDKANKYTDLEIKEETGSKFPSDTLSQRLGRLIDESSGYVILNGGQGTVNELQNTLETERMAKTLDEKKQPRPVIIMDESIEMTDILYEAYRRQKKMKAPITAENVFVLNVNPEALDLASKIMEAYYLRNLGKKTDEELKAEFGNISLGSFIENKVKFEQGSGI